MSIHSGLLNLIGWEMTAWHGSNGRHMSTKPIKNWTGSAVRQNWETSLKTIHELEKNSYLKALSAGLAAVWLETLSRNSQFSTSSCINSIKKKLFIIVPLKYFHTFSICFNICSIEILGKYLLKTLREQQTPLLSLSCLRNSSLLFAYLRQIEVNTRLMGRVSH